ncbi:MAG: preprotein translocase subunit YajC [Bacillota bacterium]|nr:preprotein translocase subunit YajC [Bacillota bacterium]
MSPDYISTIAMLAVVFGAMYFFMIRPQKKKERAELLMRNSIEVGDKIITIGGIIGKVVSVKDDETFVLETGNDKTKIKFNKWAIRSREAAADGE